MKLHLWEEEWAEKSRDRKASWYEWPVRKGGLGFSAAEGPDAWGSTLQTDLGGPEGVTK